MTVRILGIAGSLRHGSINRRLLEVLSERCPPEAEFKPFDGIDLVPLFSEDMESPIAPAGVRALWQAVRDADVLVFATPEYNQSLPGVTKNIVDWLSRDPDHGLRGKPCAVTGATVGRWGTRIAQQQLRTILNSCGAAMLTRPTLFVADGSSSEPAQAELDSYLATLLAEIEPLRIAA